MDKKSSCAILLSYYNGGPYFLKQIISLAEQDFKDFDLIVRNDGSDPIVLETAMISSFGRSMSFDVLNGKNVGFSKSFLLLNKYAFSKGYRYYSFCDQDDVWISNKLGIACDFLSSHDDGFTPLLYICGADLINENDEFIGDFKIPSKIDPVRSIFENYYPGHLMVYNESLAKLLMDINPDRVLCHDWVTLLLASLGGRVFINSESIGVHYRQHGSNHLGVPSLSSTLKRKIYGLLRFNRNKPMISSQLEEAFFVLERSNNTAFGADVPLLFLQNRGIFGRFKNLICGRVARANFVDSAVLKFQYILGIW